MYFCLKSILMKKFTFVIFILPFILVSPFIFAQNGPGGVGSPSNLNLWLKTDNLNLSEGDLVEFWYDSSDNNNTASQLTQQNRPIFRATSSLNNLPVIDFSGGDDSSTSDFMTIPGDASNFGGINQMSLFSVARPSNLGSPAAQAIISKRDNQSSTVYSFTMFFFEGNKTYTDVNNRGNGRLDGGPNSEVSNNSNFIISASFNGLQAAGNRQKLYKDSELVATSSTISSTQINSSTSQVTIGKLNVSDSRHFAGQIPEIIFYNTAVNQTQRKIIDNYLSSKFDISIANNIYTLDQPANGNFDFNVIGIGRENSSDLHRDSKGSGIIRVNNPSNLNNGEYLFIGSDILNDSSLDFTSIDCLSVAPDDILTEATWRIGKYNGDVGDVDISFDTSSIGLDPNVAELLVSSSPNFVNPTIISSSSVSGNDVVFSGVNFANGDYIKLRFKTIVPILWDGTSFSNGSGLANAPNTSDFGRKLIIDGANAELNEDANCFCATITNNSDLSLNNNILDIKKQFVNNGVFDGSEGTLEFSGDLNKFISGKSFEVANFITHANTSINLDTTLDINNLLDVRGGTLITGDDINLICNFGTPGKTAQVGPVGGTIVGDVTLEQCYPARRAFRFLSSSVTTTTSIKENWQEGASSYTDNPNPGYGTHITGVEPGSANAIVDQDGDDGFDYNPSGNASMFTFDNSNPNWDRVTNTTDVLTAGQAYRLMIRGDRSIDVTSNSSPPTNTRLSATGVLAIGGQSVSNLSGDAGAFNFIGNPYKPK